MTLRHRYVEAKVSLIVLQHGILKQLILSGMVKDIPPEKLIPLLFDEIEIAVERGERWMVQ